MKKKIRRKRKAPAKSKSKEKSMSIDVPDAQAILGETASDRMQSYEWPDDNWEECPRCHIGRPLRKHSKHGKICRQCSIELRVEKEML